MAIILLILLGISTTIPSLDLVYKSSTFFLYEQVINR